MNGPFESLDLPELDDALVCADGACAVPAAAGATAESVDEEPTDD